MSKKTETPTQRLSNGAWDPSSPYYDLQVRAHRENRALRHPDGTVVLSNQTLLCPIEMHRAVSKADDIHSIIANYLSARQDDQDADTWEEFYDFGPPSDEWDDMSPPGAMPEYRDASSWEEDAATRHFYSPPTEAGRPSPVVEAASPEASEPTQKDPDPEGAGTT